MYGRDLTSFFAHLNHLMYMYSDLDAVYLAGDLNGRIGQRSDFIEEVDDVPPRTPIDLQVKGHGEAILDFCTETKVCIVNGRISPLNDNFTSISNKGTAVVDYFLTRHDDLSRIKHFEVITMTSVIESMGVHGIVATPSGISDHSFLVMAVSIRSSDMDSSSVVPQSVSVHGKHSAPNPGVHSDGRGPRAPPRFKIDNVPEDFMNSPESRTKLLSLISNIEQNQQSQQEINTLYNNIVECFINEMGQHFPQINTGTRNGRKFRFAKKEWWDDELTQLFKDMHQSEHQYLKAKKNKLSFKNLFAIFKQKQDVFDKTLKKKKRNFQKTQSLKLEQVNSSDPTSFWEYIKKLGPRKSSKIPWECYSENGDISYSTEEILEKWKADFESLYTPSLDNLTEEELQFKEELKSGNEQFENVQSDNSSPINQPFEIGEIYKVINKSKLKKAAGIDGLVYEVLKNETTAVLLTKLFNVCFTCHKVPDVWVQALIHPIPKSAFNDPRVPLNYRGISLLSVVSKLYTSALNKRLNLFAENNNLIVDEQNGFRADRSCLDHIFVLQNTLRIRNELNNQTFCAFIDFKKAFDYVDRDALMFKLREIGIEGNFYHTLKALYTGAKSCVKVNDKLTDWFNVNSGVRQGDSLSPTLFSLFLNDLAVDIKDLDAGVMLSGICLSILLYADDIVLMAPTPEKLQIMLDTVAKWCRKWGMQININKTQILHVRNPQRPRSSFSVNCGGSALAYTDTYKYLGFIMHEHLNNTKHVNTLTASASRSFGRIYSTRSV